MPKLPSVTGQEAIAAFGRVGFKLDRVTGSHHILIKDGHRFHLSVPVHGQKPLRPGLLRKLIHNADLTVEQFISLL